MKKKRKVRWRERLRRDAVFHPEFREDLRYWVESDRKTSVRAFDLIEATMQDSVSGIGKPERLKHLAPGVWSRRLIQEPGASDRLSGERRPDRLPASAVSLLIRQGDTAGRVDFA